MKRYFRTFPILITILALAAVIGLLGANPVQAQEQGPDEPTMDQDRFVRVTGQAQVSAAPDQATVRLGVVSEAPTATAALQDNRALIEEVISATLALDIPEEQIQTQVLQLEPVREEEQAPPTPGAPTGEIIAYRARNIVSVTVDDVDMIGDVVDTAVTAGANTIEGISFEVTDRAELVSEARQQAINNARDVAETYVAALDAELGQVLVIRELGGTGLATTFVQEDLAFGGAGFPIQPGQQTIEVTVEVIWALE